MEVRPGFDDSSPLIKDPKEERYIWGGFRRIKSIKAR